MAQVTTFLPLPELTFNMLFSKLRMQPNNENTETPVAFTIIIVHLPQERKQIFLVDDSDISNEVRSCLNELYGYHAILSSREALFPNVRLLLTFLSGILEICDLDNCFFIALHDLNISHLYQIRLTCGD
jgi:hypothetical protein